MAFLEVKNITKSFGTTQVLKGVSFEMNKGEVVSVIGSSGNGKTTLLRCLNFLEIPDGGSITVDGNRIFPLPDTPEEQNKKRLTFGMVFQNFNLFPQYTALRNVTLAMDLRDENELKAQKIKGAERKRILKELRAENEEKALALLTRVGLADKTGNYPCELSGGQQQRLLCPRDDRRYALCGGSRARDAGSKCF